MGGQHEPRPCTTGLDVRGLAVMALWKGTPAQRHYAGCLLRDGYNCALERLGNCRGALQGHHIVPKQRLKREFGKDNWVIHNAVSDSRNGMLLCERHHAMNTPDIKGTDIPDLDGFLDFMEQYGLPASWMVDEG